MKYKDPITGEFKDITIKAGDTLPVGAILEFDGDVIPAGYEEVTDEVDQKEVFVGPNEPTTGEEVWLQKGKNLINAPYNEANKLTITAIKDDDFTTTDYYCYLEAGKTYSVSFKSDGEGGGVAGTDTVQIWLLKDKNYDYKYSFSAKEMSFTPGASGYYFLRVDVNQNGATHSFWNIQVEQGETATSYEPYIDKKIYTKNDNGGYEEFYNEETIIDSGVINGIHYIKFPDGTLIQRGNYNTTNINPSSGFFQKVDLPIPFIDTQYAVNITKCSGGSSLFSQVADACWRQPTYIEFTNWNNTASGTSDPIVYSWTAIGRWK